MMNFEPQFPSTSTSDTWLGLLKTVSYGNLTKPRGKITWEVLGCRSVINMSQPVVCVEERKLGYHFMTAEAAWIMSGDNRVKTITPFSKEIANFSDDGERFFGAYGPKIIDQIAYVAKTLSLDVDSRQAVISIWRPNPPITKDVPCTLSLQWIIREGRLNCFANMRSSDVWLGVPYDWFNFSALSMGLLIMLNNRKNPTCKPFELGNLYFYAASQHLYQEQFEKTKFILYDLIPKPFTIKPANCADFSTYDNLVDHLWRVAKGEHFNGWLKELAK